MVSAHGTPRLLTTATSVVFVLFVFLNLSKCVVFLGAGAAASVVLVTLALDLLLDSAVVVPSGATFSSCMVALTCLVVPQNDEQLSRTDCAGIHIRFFYQSTKLLWAVCVVKVG